MASEPRFCSYLDIPLQHSHPDILRAMRRAGSATSYLALLEEARRENYAMIRAYFHKSESEGPHFSGKLFLRSIEILEGYHAVGRSLDTLRSLRKLRVVGLRRGASTIDDPAMDSELEPGDVLIIEGYPGEIEAAEIEIMSGL